MAAPTMNAHLTASSAPRAQQAQAACVARLGQAERDDADVVVAFGGDGFMLATLHHELDRVRAGHPARPVYGVHSGTVGFLMNAAAEPDELARQLRERVHAAAAVALTPLRADLTLADGTRRSCWALNEVAVRRAGAQAAVVAVHVDGKPRLDRLAGDGVMVASPTGSAAYNFSAGGPVLPLSAAALALTPICPMSPRRWPGAVVPAAATIGIDVLELPKRPVIVTADMTAVENVAAISVRADASCSIPALFDDGHDLDERLLAVQFATGR